MTGPIVAGIDIGNATTEVVIGAAGTPVAWDRIVTRGLKGSPSSVRGAAGLVRRLERRLGYRVDRAVLAPLRPVRTTTALVPDTGGPAGGPLRVLVAGAGTPGGTGVGVGRPVPVPALAGVAGPVVAVVGREVGYRAAAAFLAGADAVVAVLVEADEGRLIANRIPAGPPVVDGLGADGVAAALAAALLAVEVRPAGSPLRKLSDALYLADTFGLPAAAAAEVCRSLRDVANAVIAYLPGTVADPAAAAPAWVEVSGGERLDFGAVPAAGEVVRFGVPDAEPEDTADLFTVDLGAVADAVHARVGATGSRSYAYSSLASGPPVAATEPVALLGAELGVPVDLAAGEAVASRRGALSTPGTAADTLVIDLGGGTLDVVDQATDVVVAGCGDLLTAAVAAVLGTPHGAAEWVKRGRCVRVENPHLVVHEDGSREFLDRPAAAGAVGWTAAPGPAGLLPFSRRLGPAEWRSLRLTLKDAVLGVNVRRALAAIAAADRPPGAAVVVGGPAGDDEILAVLAGALPAGTALGRGDVAGVLGHRYAVAWGLACDPETVGPGW